MRNTETHPKFSKQLPNSTKGAKKIMFACGSQSEVWHLSSSSRDLTAKGKMWRVCANYSQDINLRASRHISTVKRTTHHPVSIFSHVTQAILCPGTSLNSNISNILGTWTVHRDISPSSFINLPAFRTKIIIHKVIRETERVPQ